MPSRSGPLARPFAWLLVGTLIACAGSSQAGDAPVSGDDFFESQVRPLLTSKCLSCHGESRPKAGLRLDSHSALMKGGASGPALVPGNLDESLLITAIRREGPEMPPSGPLDDAQIQILEQWVAQGAHWPDSSTPLRTDGPRITEQDRGYWAFQSPQQVAPPAVSRPGWARNPIDRFVLKKLDEAKLTPAPEADRATLIRRLSFDLLGLPPTPTEVAAFVADPAPDAYERLVERLLASPHHGERWGRHWLDVVRFAESNGYRADEFRASAWKYRDYVVSSLNADLPYDQFVIEQLAGDELPHASERTRTATGYLRLWTYESNQRDVRGQWSAILNDITDVTADAFMALGMACARCHDHKYDPLLQDDYFRLRAVFEPVVAVDDPGDLPEAHPITGTAERQAVYDWLSRSLIAERDSLELQQRQKAVEGAVTKFQKDLQAILAAQPGTRSPADEQLARLAYRQVQMEIDKIPSLLKGDEKKRWEEIDHQLKALSVWKPDAPDDAMVVRDLSSSAPPTLIPGASDATPIPPGPPAVMAHRPMPVEPPGWLPESTGRRLAFARWLASPDHPLTARVVVNRIWQYHFGRGLAANANDFGRLGEAPSHPELLDWLATRLIADGWSLKSIHRLIVTSATYRQSSRRVDLDQANRIDPENRLLWHMPARRLEAEPVRDALLSASGELETRLGGPSTDNAPRRSLYLKVLRNRRDPVLDAYDPADGFLSMPQRYVSSTSNQALLMLNNAWTLDRARSFAARLIREGGALPRDRVEYAYRLVFGRSPHPDELEAAIDYLKSRQEPSPSPEACESCVARSEESAWADFCHVLLSSNEFIYID